MTCGLTVSRADTSYGKDVSFASREQLNSGTLLINIANMYCVCLCTCDTNLGGNDMTYATMTKKEDETWENYTMWRAARSAGYSMHRKEIRLDRFMGLKEDKESSGEKQASHAT